MNLLDEVIPGQDQEPSQNVSSLARIEGIPVEKWNALTRLGTCSTVAYLLTCEKGIYTPPIHSQYIPSGPAQFSLPLQGKQVVLAEPVLDLIDPSESCRKLSGVPIHTGNTCLPS